MTQFVSAAYFIAKADQCFGLAKSLREEHADGRVADELDSIANEFLARAVEIDTERDRAQLEGRR
jgi:hypothetical protein